MLQKDNAINIEENIKENLGKVNEITRKELERYIDKKVKYAMRYFYKKGVRDGMYFSKLISSKE